MRNITVKVSYLMAYLQRNYNDYSSTIYIYICTIKNFNKGMFCIYSRSECYFTQYSSLDYLSCAYFQVQ